MPRGCTPHCTHSKVDPSTSCDHHLIPCFSKDRAHQDEKVVRRQANIQELVAVKDSEKRLQHELQITKEQLRNEQLKFREATQKVE